MLMHTYKILILIYLFIIAKKSSLDPRVVWIELWSVDHLANCTYQPAMRDYNPGWGASVPRGDFSCLIPHPGACFLPLTPHPWGPPARWLNGLSLRPSQGHMRVTCTLFVAPKASIGVKAYYTPLTLTHYIVYFQLFIKHQYIKFAYIICFILLLLDKRNTIIFL